MATTTKKKGDINKPLSMWGYFGYQMLFSIPVAGFVCLILISFNAKNVNLRNFARSFFCSLIVVMVMIVVILLCGGGAALAEALRGVLAEAVLLL